MSGDVVDEFTQRARMALADTGMSPALVKVRDGAAWMDSDVDPVLRWRVGEVTLISDPVCFACALAADQDYIATLDRDRWDDLNEACEASRRFEQDCGVSR